MEYIGVSLLPISSFTVDGIETKSGLITLGWAILDFH